MSENDAHDADMEHDNEINAEDVAGAQEIAAPAQRDEPMAEEPTNVDRLLAEFMQLSHADQELFATHVPAPISAIKQHLQQPGMMPAQTAVAARTAERTLSPPEPKYDGSTNWEVYRMRVQQWLVACGTPVEQWGLRALACLTGAASAYIDSELSMRRIGFYDMQFDPDRFSWSEFDSLMQLWQPTHRRQRTQQVTQLPAGPLTGAVQHSAAPQQGAADPQ